jgi:8-oxo-dGTP pyrophosphatase MutT (NUDIX family)
MIQDHPVISEGRPSLHFSLAILLRSGRYVLQLRDNKPDIAAPGLWALFGGAVEQNEAAEEAVRREVYEELRLEVGRFRYLWTTERYNDFFQQPATYSFFEADVTHCWESHQLLEGQEAADYAVDQLGNLQMPPFIRAVLVKHSEMSSNRTSP